MRILIIRTDRLGDLILSTPVVRSLRAAYPDAYLAMMVDARYREIVEGNPDLNQLFLLETKGEHKSWGASWKLARRLRAEKFDAALILHSTDRVILMSWLAGIPKRIGYARRLRWLLTDSLPYVKREGVKHELEYNLDLLRFLGVSATERALGVVTTDAQREKVAGFLRAHGVREDGPLIVVHPGASCRSKRWPAERYAEAADRLIERHGAQVIVITSGPESRYGEAVVSKMRRLPVAAFGQFSLGELACLFRRASCLISNDSGPVHLASAVGAPVVSIFGRWGGGLSPVRWGPTNGNGIALHRDVGCRPCSAHNCEVGFRCLEAVTVDEVIASVEYLAKFNGHSK